MFNVICLKVCYYVFVRKPETSKKGRILNRNKKNKISTLEIRQAIREHGADILKHPNFLESARNIQHGDVSVMKHSLKVAYAAAWLNKKLHINCSERDLIRGALLHDYFLYDWHDTNRENFNPLHGFYHPGVALKNASKDFDLTEKEADIIKKHMWPMTIKPPKFREGWVVTAADKYISTLESLRLHNRSRMIRLRRRISGQDNLHHGQKLDR